MVKRKRADQRVTLVGPLFVSDGAVDGFATGAHRALFSTIAFASDRVYHKYQVAPGDSSFLFVRGTNRGVDDAGSGTVVVVDNWFEELKVRAPDDDHPERLAAALADRYRFEGELGAGGMATVYLAEDLKHRRRVAVKVLKPELAARTRRRPLRAGDHDHGRAPASAAIVTGRASLFSVAGMANATPLANYDSRPTVKPSSCSASTRRRASSPSRTCPP